MPSLAFEGHASSHKGLQCKWQHFDSILQVLHCHLRIPSRIRAAKKANFKIVDTNLFELNFDFIFQLYTLLFTWKYSTSRNVKVHAFLWQWVINQPDPSSTAAAAVAVHKAPTRPREWAESRASEDIEYCKILNRVGRIGSRIFTIQSSCCARTFLHLMHLGARRSEWQATQLTFGSLDASSYGTKLAEPIGRRHSAQTKHSSW